MDKRGRVRFSDILNIPENFDKGEICKCIREKITADEHDELEGIDFTLDSLVEYSYNAPEEEQREWSEKWGKYLEEEQ